MEKARSPSIMVSEYEGVFHGGDSTLIYNWIDNKTSDSHLQVDVKESATGHTSLQVKNLPSSCIIE
jgi:hypothetical protein